jgi:hypothetical protein
MYPSEKLIWGGSTQYLGRKDLNATKEFEALVCAEHPPPKDEKASIPPIRRLWPEVFTLSSSGGN